MPPSPFSRLTTDTAFIQDVITDIRKGEIKIPQFQRKFVWKEKQALDLLDSIAKTYPVGSLLLWKTTVKLDVVRNIGNFKLPETDDLTPTNYVLDGQQRITVIYSCLGAPDSQEGFAAGYDLAEEAFIEQPPEHVPYVFPLRWLLDTTKMLDFRTGLKSYPAKGGYQARLDRLISSFTSYRLPIVTLKDLTIEEVCPIFERINSSGTKLSIFDLMVAATWTHKQFDLNDEAENISDALTSKGFDNIERDTILKCLTAVRFSGIKKAQILSLRDIPSEERESAVSRTSEALLKAVDILNTEFRIHSWDFLPYEAFVIILCYILSKKKTLTAEQHVRLRQWFWRSSFSERYRVGGESFITKDLEVVRQSVMDGKADPSFGGDPPSAARLSESLFRISNSRARAFVLALATLKPRNITNGAAIDPAVALSSFNRKQFHHIFPKAFLKREGSSVDPNSIVNICMLSASENNAISDQDPRTYIPACVSSLGSSAESVFASNLLPSPSKFNYGTATYETFFRERSKMVADYVKTLCEGQVH